MNPFNHNNEEAQQNSSLTVEKNLLILLELPRLLKIRSTSRLCHTQSRFQKKLWKGRSICILEQILKQLLRVKAFPVLGS